MSALERKRRPCIVIKIGRLPAILVVATGAFRHVPATGKLPRMRIAVAAGTLEPDRAKVHMFQRRSQIRRSVAIYACHPSVRAD
jgi:hypothetical protein